MSEQKYLEKRLLLKRIRPYFKRLGFYMNKAYGGVSIVHDEKIGGFGTEHFDTFEYYIESKDIKEIKSFLLKPLEDMPLYMEKPKNVNRFTDGKKIIKYVLAVKRLELGI